MTIISILLVLGSLPSSLVLVVLVLVLGYQQVLVVLAGSLVLVLLVLLLLLLLPHVNDITVDTPESQPQHPLVQVLHKYCTTSTGTSASTGCYSTSSSARY
jgi:hypothetical protein